MKKTNLILIVFFFITFIISSCSKDKKVSAPSVSLSAYIIDSTLNKVEAKNIKINQPVTFTVTGDFDFASVWTGDSAHIYDNKIPTLLDTAGYNYYRDYGANIPQNTKTFTYPTYTKAGVYKVILTATNIDLWTTKEKQTIVSLPYQITVSN